MRASRRASKQAAHPRYSHDSLLGRSETKFGHVAALTKRILAQASGRSSEPDEGKLPLLIFWHGGCLVAGTKDWTPKWLLNGRS